MAYKTNQELVDHLLANTWYPQQNDLIGGACIMTVDKPPSQCNIHEDEYEVGDFLGDEVARHIADLHNAHLKQKDHQATPVVLDCE